MGNTLRNIAIYLPQFHPIPENDTWWGKGFTEWTNVVKAKPRFKGHYQPQLPSDLSYYDLRLSEARLAQEALAKQYQVHGFCYYHYWFNGKRLLQQPLDEKLKNPKEDLPFMMCWANENWARNWDGGNHQLLLKQEYSEDDDRLHIQTLIPYFKDERYIKVNGKPIFIFYKPEFFPDMAKTIQIFREEARKANLELYLCWFERSQWIGKKSIELGLDAAIEFQPFTRNHKAVIQKTRSNYLLSKKYLHRQSLRVAHKVKRSLRKDKGDVMIDYKTYVDVDLASPPKDYKCYPCVCPGWDNSSRRAGIKATIFTDSTPEVFQHWYKQKKQQFTPFSEEENFMYINAWNEWAEGNHLEPCHKWGHSFLKALVQ